MVVSLSAALPGLVSSGLSVIPTREDKRPLLGSWEAYQSRLPSPEEMQSWGAVPGFGVVCGAVSGGLFCIDVDTKNDPTGKLDREYWDLVREQAPDLWDRLIIERTPSGGLHLVARCKKGIRNLKLARSKSREVLIETRGEGGYFCAAPTPGYKLTRGNFETIPEIAPEDLDILLDCARALNEEEKPATKAPQVLTGGLTPLDDYDSKMDPQAVVALLEAHGWKVVSRRGEALYFRRPGKEGRGISATYNHIPGRFYCFSTSTPFETEHVYKPYAVYSILEHDGDFQAAARTLANQGYGEKRPEKPGPKPAARAELGDLAKKVFHLYDHGVKKGVSPGWKLLAEHYSIVKGQLNIVTGIPSHGKSEFTDALLTNLAEKEGWRFVVYSPENYPVELHARKLIEKYIGKPMFGFGRMNLVELGEGVKYLEKHFVFLDGCDEDLSLDSILLAVEREMENGGVDGVLIDPWNELEAARPKDTSETDFIGLCLKRCRIFARKHDIGFWIVAHPYKLRKDPKSGKYPIPTMYDISGSAHWYNKADNGITIWRDFEENFTEVHIQKIKFKYYGKTGIVRMRYDALSGRYSEWENADYFRPTPQPKQLPPEQDDEEIHF